MSNNNDDSKEPTRIVIIGGSVSAFYCLSDLLDNHNRFIVQILPLEIEIIEASDKFINGVAWNKDNLRPFHKTNFYARDGSEIPREEWATDEQAGFYKLLDILRAHGVQIKLTPNTSAIGYKKEHDHHLITTQDKKNNIEEKKADHMILAMGSWQGKTTLTDNEGIFSSPWPAAKLEQEIDFTKPIGVEGTGLTTVDTILTLGHAAGKFEHDKSGKVTYTPNHEGFEIVACSPSGLLPPVADFLAKNESVPRMQGLIDKYAQDKNGVVYLDKLYEVIKYDFLARYIYSGTYAGDKNLPALQAIMEDPESTFEKMLMDFYNRHQAQNSTELLRAQIKEAEHSRASKEPILWRKYLSEMVVYIHYAYNKMGAEDKERFDRDIKPLYAKTIAGMVLDNAKEVLALMEAGCLEIKALETGYSIGTKHEGDKKLPGIEVRYLSEKDKPHEYYSTWVKATGDRHEQLWNSSPFIESLHDAGVIQPVVTAFADQAEGKRRFEEEGGKGTTQIVQGKYCLCEGTIFINMDTGETIPKDHNKNTAPATNISAVGPLIIGQFSLIQGTGIIKAVAKDIMQNIVERIAEKKIAPVKEFKIFVSVQPQLSAVVVFDAVGLLPGVARELQKSIAQKHGLDINAVAVVRRGDVPDRMKRMVDNDFAHNSEIYRA
jgi:hypothetical protein